LNYYSLISITEKKTDFTVRAKLLVCPNGKFTISKINIENKYYSSLKLETERLLKLLTGFKPATKNGVNVASYYWIQINYKPNKKVEQVGWIIKTD